MWEFSRYEWGELEAMVSAAVIPRAIEKLLNSSSEEKACAAFRVIENNAFVQGTLYEAAAPTAACLVVALPFCPPIARPTILELLNLMGGWDAWPEESHEERLQFRCLQEVRKGVASYLTILESGSARECRECIDLLCLCAEVDPSLIE